MSAGSSQPDPIDRPNVLVIRPGLAIPLDILDATFARSSGPGGQNVNKRNTKAQIRLSLERLSEHIGPPAVARLRGIAAWRCTDAGDLLIDCDSHRSASQNLADCQELLAALIRQSLVIPRKRRPTRPTRSSKQRRLDSKAKHAEHKRNRARPGHE